MSTHMVDNKLKLGGDAAALQAKIDALNAEASQNWDNPQWRALMAQQVTETILEGFQHENLLSLMATVENVPFDGRIFVKETRGLRAFWTSRGGYIEASTIRSESMEIQRDMIGFHVYENEDKLRTGFAETQANLIDLGTQRLDAEVNLRVLRLFQAAIPSSSPFYVQGAGLSLPALNTSIREVADASNGGEVVIVGRRTMTDQIADELTGGNYAGFLPETNEALIQRGVLGRYKGARIISLQNFKDDEDLPFFPANEMFVMSTDASKFGFWGGLLAKDFVEDDNWYWHYIARRDFGGVVHRPERVRRIVDTSIPA